MLRAGLKGIEEGYELMPAVEDDIFEMNEEEMAERGIGVLPGSLGEAIKIAKNSELLKEALGEEVHAKFVANKEAEWNAYRTQVHQYEIDNYLPML